MFKTFLSTTLALTLFASLCLTGCGGGGARTSTVQETRTTTVGQELLDLQKAYEAGTINESQYQAQKKKILRN